MMRKIIPPTNPSTQAAADHRDPRQANSTAGTRQRRRNRWDEVTVDIQHIAARNRAVGCRAVGCRAARSRGSAHHHIGSVIPRVEPVGLIHLLVIARDDLRPRGVETVVAGSVSGHAQPTRTE
jgi:hypothetical protein